MCNTSSTSTPFPGLFFLYFSNELNVRPSHAKQWMHAIKAKGGWLVGWMDGMNTSKISAAHKADQSSSKLLLFALEDSRTNWAVYLTGWQASLAKTVEYNQDSFSSQKWPLSSKPGGEKECLFDGKGSGNQL